MHGRGDSHVLASVCCLVFSSCSVLVVHVGL